jgi:signal peptidase I
MTNPPSPEHGSTPFPAEGTPAEQTPVEQTPGDHAPGDQAPGDQAPGDQARFEGPPGDGIPADGPPADGIAADGTRTDGVAFTPAGVGPAAPVGAIYPTQQIDPIEPAAPTQAASEPAPTAAQPEPEPEPEPEPQADKKSGSFLRELPVLIAIALVLALLIKAFLVQAFYIPSGSMEQTLGVGDRVLVNKLVYRFRDIHRGEIVVFNGNDTSFEDTPETTCTPPSNAIVRAIRGFASAIGVAPPCEKDFIKRVIGVEGDRVQCCDEQGRVSVNNVPLQETYLYQDDKQAFGPVIVPKDKLWVMGDHRSASQDSRAHTNAPDHGFIPTHKVVGRAFVKVWPLGHIGGLPVPKTFTQKALDSIGGPLPASNADPSLALGLLGALPLVRLRRRRRLRRPQRGPT